MLLFCICRKLCWSNCIFWKIFFFSFFFRIFETTTEQEGTKAILVQNLEPYMEYQLRLVANNVVGASEPSEPSRKFQTIQVMGDDIVLKQNDQWCGIRAVVMTREHPFSPRRTVRHNQSADMQFNTRSSRCKMTLLKTFSTINTAKELHINLGRRACCKRLCIKIPNLVHVPVKIILWLVAGSSY